MANLARAVAALRIDGDKLDPEEISTALGCTPSQAWRKGEAVKTYLKKSGGWRLDATDTEPENLDAQVRELLTRTTDNLDIWRELSRRFEVDLFCGWFMEESNEGVCISPETLSALGTRGITLSLDIYGPIQENEPDPEPSS